MTLPTIGPYQMLHKLGEGGMGTVYEAVHQGIGRHVAIKLLYSQLAANREIVTRFFNEARAAARVDHPGIVQIFDCGQLPDGTPYLIMEILKGESLAARLQREVLSPMQVLQVGWQISAALAAAHHVGIVHRDLKPENIMLVPDQMLPDGERVKVLDFGIAKLSQSGSEATRNNVILGTPRYMSPEQCRGAAGVNDRADVYSLGVVLFEMFARRPMFEVDSPNAYLFLHATEDPPPLSSVSPLLPSKIGSLVDRLLVKAPALRPRMSEVAAELRTLSERPEPINLPSLSSDTPTEPVTKLSELTLFAQTAVAVTPPPQSERRLPRLGRLAALLACGVLLSLAQPWRLLHRWKPPLREPAGRALPSLPTAESPAEMVAPAVAPAIIATDAEAPPAVASSPGAVRWEIDSEPPGATVLAESGAQLGTTPWRQERSSEDGTSKLRLRLRGYREQRVFLARDHDVVRVEHLQPLDKPASTSPRMQAVSKLELHGPAPQKSVLDDVD